MIRVSVMYPNSSGAIFDIDYYCHKHLPLAAELLGDAVKNVAVDSGLSGAQPEEAPAFIAMGHFIFESVESFQQAFRPNAEKILADVPNYTNTQPQIQISDIKTNEWI